MTRDELAKTLATNLSLPTKDVARVVRAALDLIEETLAAGGTVSLPGFGKFTTSLRSARDAGDPRNPTERIRVPAVRVPKFYPGERLKGRVRNNANA